jgi:hypothetical protein
LFGGVFQSSDHRSRRADALSPLPVDPPLTLDAENLSCVPPAVRHSESLKRLARAGEDAG